MDHVNDAKQTLQKTVWGPLVQITVLTLLGMTAYEGVKQVVWPDITIWQSHALTVLFSTVIAGVVGWLVLRRLWRLHHEREIQNTARRRAEREREHLIAELEKKNAELERYTYTVSHDLKSPLVTIKGYLGLLERDVAQGDTDRIKGDMLQIGDAADKMERLLGELLDLSRIGRQMNPPEVVSLTELAREAAGLVAGQLDKRSVEVEIDPAMPFVAIDRVRLVEVFQNLIDNAVKFMGDQASPRVEIGAKLDDGWVRCHVRDNGIGIEALYHEKVFDIFERLDPRVEGTGIGLALVKRIIETHRGRVWVESGTQRGTTFYFTLPELTDDDERPR